MKRICKGCGSEIPDGAEFCYACGAWAKDSLTINDEATFIYSDMCLNCGKELPKGSEFCPYCGTKAEKSHIPIANPVRPKFTYMDYLAIVLAVIPGFFNIFGLGHIVQKQWSKAFMYICISAIILYIAPSMLVSVQASMLMLFFEFLVLMFSVMDVFRNIYNRGA